MKMRGVSFLFFHCAVCQNGAESDDAVDKANFVRRHRIPGFPTTGTRTDSDTTTLSVLGEQMPRNSTELIESNGESGDPNTAAFVNNTHIHGHSSFSETHGDGDDDEDRLTLYDLLEHIDNVEVLFCCQWANGKDENEARNAANNNLEGKGEKSLGESRVALTASTFQHASFMKGGKWFGPNGDRRAFFYNCVITIGRFYCSGDEKLAGNMIQLKQISKDIKPHYPGSGWKNSFGIPSDHQPPWK